MAKTKPTPPYQGFPLWWHPRGGWAKKIKGRIYYFGKDATSAEAEFNAVRDDLHAGRQPREWMADGVTIADLFNEFLEKKTQAVEAGELTAATFRDYHDILKIAADALGKKTVVANLRPTDFWKLRSALGDGITSRTLKKRIVCTRAAFRWGHRNGRLKEQPLYGDEFTVPKAAKIDNERHERQLEHGVRVFNATETTQLIGNANKTLKAMILLAVNCGFTQVDISDLPEAAIDFENGVIDWWRKKKGTIRRCTLWPETIDALQNVPRKQPKAQDHAGLFFITSHGYRYVRFQQSEGKLYESRVDAVHTMFKRLVLKLGIDRQGRGFGSFRHTFRTQADAAMDDTATNLIMGHKAADIGRKHYLRIQEGDFDARLRAVTDHVREWLFSD